jgi:hypothetical protein
VVVGLSASLDVPWYFPIQSLFVCMDGGVVVWGGLVVCVCVCVCV